jgi:hypothetical protein
MNEKVQPSCWGLTAKAVIGIAALMVLAWLAGSPDASAVLASG